MLGTLVFDIELVSLRHQLKNQLRSWDCKNKLFSVMPMSGRMDLRFKQVLLVLLFLVVLNSYVTAELEKENSQRSRAAPLRNTADSVIDGSGTEDAFYSGESKGDNVRVSATTVALFTLAMAAATGLGAVPFFFVELDPQWAGMCNGMAAGVMLAASFDLIQEGRDT